MFKKNCRGFFLAIELRHTRQTGVSPCEMLMNCRLRSCLDFSLRYRESWESSSKTEARSCMTRGHWDSSLKVYVQDFTTRKPKLIPGTVAEVTGPLSHMIKLQDGATVWRQKEQLLTRILTHWCLDLSWVVWDHSISYLDLSRGLSARISRVRNAKCFSENWPEFHPVLFDTIL